VFKCGRFFLSWPATHHAPLPLADALELDGFLIELFPEICLFARRRVVLPKLAPEAGNLGL
jgi:hypothetical protein